MNSVRVFALMAFAPLAVAARSDSGRLVLRVIDGAQVPAVTLQKAMHRVESAFRAAGIEMQWLSTCLVDSTAPEPKRMACDQNAPGVSHVLEICILGAFGVASTVRSDVLGIANVGSGRAYVLWNRIRGSELAKSASEDKALAMVMLHEAGHVAGLQHAPTGIMRRDMCTGSASAASTASGLVTYTPSEAAQIRRNASFSAVVHRGVQDEDDRNR